MIIYIGADHRGFEKKKDLIKFLVASNIPVEDVGAFEYKETDDFNDPAIKVSQKVRKDHNAMGILICGSANGVAIQANRFKGIRAITASNNESVELGRAHTDANVLCLSAEFLSVEYMQHLIKTFLTTDFANEVRYIRRNNRLDEEVIDA